MAPSLYRQVFRRSEFDRKAGIHHLDWILYDKNHHKIDSVKYFEVITYHHSIEKEEQPDFEWTLNGFFHQRIISKTIFPSDHFPIIAGFAINS